MDRVNLNIRLISQIKKTSTLLLVPTSKRVEPNAWETINNWLDDSNHHHTLNVFCAAKVLLSGI
jgi:hypothetical protein